MNNKNDESMALGLEMYDTMKKFNNQKQRLHKKDEGVTEKTHRNVFVCNVCVCVICSSNRTMLCYLWRQWERITYSTHYMHNETINWYVKHDKHFVNRHIHIDVCAPFRYSIVDCCCILFLIWWINWNNILCSYDLMVWYFIVYVSSITLFVFYYFSFLISWTANSEKCWNSNRIRYWKVRLSS